MKKSVFIAILFAFSLSLAYSQEALKSTEEEYYDFLSLTGTVERPTLGYRTLSDSVWNYNIEDSNADVWKNNNLGSKMTFFESSADGNWFTNGLNRSLSLKIYGPEWYNSYNTALPYGQNDGALWQGKGYNTSLTGGARFEAYGLELTFKPQLCFSQNAEFEFLSGVYGSEYSYFTAAGGGIDLVQRFGDSPFWTFDWGDSEIRYTWYTLTVGFGTQSPWIGPAWLNPMLGSNNASTYPKFDFGLRKTPITIPWLNWYIGDIESRIWMGYLSESDYFDNDSSNDHNRVNGFNISYAPSFIPGLTLGATKICLTKWTQFEWKYLNPFYKENSSIGVSGSGEDQKASVYADWILPEAGFEIFAEIGVDDYSSDILTNPFHTMIYTVGLKKSTDISKTLSGEIIFEWNNSEMSQDFQLQWCYTGFYSHSQITQGYTNRGQILGAGTGYFGNSQYLGYRLYYPKGNTLIFIHRFCNDNNYIYNKSVYEIAGSLENYYASMETYLVCGFQTSYFLNTNLNISAGYNFIYCKNPLYTKYTSCIGHNFSISLKLNI